jgi:hypothetical protein
MMIVVKAFNLPRSFGFTQSVLLAPLVAVSKRKIVCRKSRDLDVTRLIRSKQQEKR